MCKQIRTKNGGCSDNIRAASQGKQGFHQFSQIWLHTKKMKVEKKNQHPSIFFWLPTGTSHKNLVIWFLFYFSFKMW
jgi:hypothetical protein